MNKTAKLKPKDSLKFRVGVVKSVFPPGLDYTPLYQYEFGLQSESDLEKIRNVWNMRATDEQITENLEKLVKKVKNKLGE